MSPDKIWDVNQNHIKIFNQGKIRKIKTNPLIFVNKLINDFKVKLPKELPPMSAMLVGYFSYDVIRYIENIKDTCKDDLKIPDIRLLKPKNLVIYDDLKKQIYYIENIFGDEKIKNYDEKYRSVLRKFELFQGYENIKLPDRLTFKTNLNKVKSNISKKDSRNG